MADVLDQNEVDALLAAVDSSPPGKKSTNTASPSAPRRVEVPQKEAHTYDFKRPERVSKDQMRSLESLHESFARNLGASLSSFLRTIVEVRVSTIEQLTYSEFIHSLPNPTNFNLLSCEPLEGQMCLEISPLIIYPIIDRLLGGSSNEMFIPQRPLTSIELRLIQKMTDRALTELSEVWSDLVKVEFKLSETESNPHLVQIVAPNEVVVVIGFELRMGPRAGTMSLCIPFNVIEPAMSKLATQGWLSYRRNTSTESQTGAILSRIDSARIELRAHLADTTITVEELLALQPGDIIQTTKPSDEELLIQVEGKNKFAAQVGRNRLNRAVKISRALKPGDPLERPVAEVTLEPT
ncbi:MAG: flagellar motor switch protein FliM [Planctomycetes bacterium]|nr:flagellar motor switch protein FliM [Planctomycetota bacterium]